MRHATPAIGGICASALLSQTFAAQKPPRCRHAVSWTQRFRRQILGWPMPQENVEIVRRSFAEFDRGGIDSALGYFDPEIEWTTTDAYIESATYRGHEGVRLYFETMAEEFDDLRMEAEELI